RWDAAIVFGSVTPALLWGVVFANMVRGVRLDARHDYVGTLGDLLNPYALLGGLTTAALFVTHGAVFIALKTDGEIRVRARRLAGLAGGGAAGLAVAFLGGTLGIRATGWTWALAVAALVALLAALVAVRAGREGWAFAGTAAAIRLAVAVLFTALYPVVLP